MEITFRNIIFVGGVFLLCYCYMFIEATSNELCKIYHHVFDVSKDGNSAGIEFGKVAFYFEKSPEIRVVSDRDIGGDKRRLTIVFPKTNVKSKTCAKSIAELSASKSPWYKILFEESSDGGGNLSLTLTFDLNVVDMQYDIFDAINRYKGLMFTFYNRKLVEKLNRTEKKLIQLAHGKTRPHVIVDCGHGGCDSGAIGISGVKEKDVVFSVGRELADLLRSDGISVALTRDTDVFVPLDKRGASRYMPAANSDAIFISLHANYASNVGAKGIELFCLSPPLIKKSFSTANIYCQHVVEKIFCEKCKSCQLLAHCLHATLLESATVENKQIIDRKIKHSVAQVFLGSPVPAVLLELGFLSHPYESVLLSTASYQCLLAQGIHRGILHYFRM